MFYSDFSLSKTVRGRSPNRFFLSMNTIDIPTFRHPISALPHFIPIPHNHRACDVICYRPHMNPHLKQQIEKKECISYDKNNLPPVAQVCNLGPQHPSPNILKRACTSVTHKNRSRIIEGCKFSRNEFGTGM